MSSSRHRRDSDARRDSNDDYEYQRRDSYQRNGYEDDYRRSRDRDGYEPRDYYDDKVFASSFSFFLLEKKIKLSHHLVQYLQENAVDYSTYLDTYDIFHPASLQRPSPPLSR